MGTTLQERLDRLDEAPEADADLGFPSRMLALCILPRTGQGGYARSRLRDDPEISSWIPGKKRPGLGLCWVFSESGNLEYLGKRTPELRSQVFVT